jgi:large subunit ribosomal protein L30
MAKLEVRLVKSPIGQTPRNKKTVEALGLKKLNQVVFHEDSASIRGMLHNVRHMIEVRISGEKDATA